MPISWHEVIPHIMNKVEQLKPKTILDIGVGFGKYGVLLRELLELPFERYKKDKWDLQIDGVEAFEGYKNPLHDYAYNHVFYEDITNLVDELTQYDVILMIDVLEHFDKETGLSLLGALVKITKKAIVISTPKYPDPQEEYLGNKFEEHKSRWTNVDFCDFDFTSELVQIRKNGAQLFVIYPPQEQTVWTTDEFPAKQSASEKKSLTIGYFLPHHNLTGGLKMLLEQMRHLQNNGHEIVAFYRGEPGEKVLPDWVDLKIDKEILVPNGELFLSYIGDCDIGVAGWLEQLPELAGAKIPIVYWEQGNEWLFGENLPNDYRAYLQLCYLQPVSLASVSPIVSKVIEARYNRKSMVIANGIDTDFYYPTEATSNESEILLVGNPNLLFKGFDVAIRSLILAWKAGGRFKVKWICQESPHLEDVPFPFPIEYVENPRQADLARHYRESDIFFFTSWYEGFGMPPLEAMASGIPVVMTRCGGVNVYAEDGVNAIMADPGDAKGLAEGIIYLLNHPEERKRLSKKGRETAVKYNFKKVIKELESYLNQLVEQ